MYRNLQQDDGVLVSPCWAARLYDRGHRSAECEGVDYGGFERGFSTMPNVDELYVTVKPTSFHFGADFSIPCQCAGDIPYNKQNLILIFLMGHLWRARQSEKTLGWQ